MIYLPEEDSFLLEKEVRKFSIGKRVLDVGCGSGILMDAALDCGALEVFGVDIDRESLEFCQGKDLDVIESDLLSNVKGKFDLIVFNPPYLPKDEREDCESSRATSGGINGDEIIVRFLENVVKHLERDGKVLLIVSSLTPMDNVDRVMAVEDFEKLVLSKKKNFMEELSVLEISAK
jgi:release factor glutamine methyltransferase